MKTKNQLRKERLLSNGSPRYIRCYDNGGESIDRFTVVYTGRYEKGNGYNKQFEYVSMSENPFHPQGFGQHGGADHLIDQPTYGHLGKKIKFEQLSEDCRKLVLSDYCEIWNIK